MASSSWVSGGLSANCASDWVDEQEDAVEATLTTRLYFRKVVPAGAVNFVGAKVVPGPLATDVPASSKIMYGLVVQGSVVELTTPRQTPEAFSVRCSVASGGVELYAGVAQVRHDLITIASTTGSLATVLLNSSATATRIFSGTVQVEPLTTTAAGTKIV
jgi:hypothetical protein